MRVAGQVEDGHRVISDAGDALEVVDQVLESLLGCRFTDELPRRPVREAEREQLPGLAKETRVLLSKQHPAFSVTGAITRWTRLDVAGATVAAVASRWSTVQGKQSLGTWVLAGYRVHLTRTQSVSRAPSDEDVARASMLAQDRDGLPSDLAAQLERAVSVPDLRASRSTLQKVELELVWLDVDNAAWVDTFAANSQNANQVGPLRDIAATQDPAKLPRRYKRWREDGLAIISEQLAAAEKQAERVADLEAELRRPRISDEDLLRMVAERGLVSPGPHKVTSPDISGTPEDEGPLPSAEEIGAPVEPTRGPRGRK